MKRRILITLSLVILICFNPVTAQKKKEAVKEPEKKETGLSSSTFSGLSFRSIGPAWASGRISDFAVNPENTSEIYVAVSAGNIWKTTNNGTTWLPIFDNYGAYAIGCFKLDPNNPYVIWAGTGENNHQRQLGYGDGVISVTEDGGKNWTRITSFPGVPEYTYVSDILPDKFNENIVYVSFNNMLQDDFKPYILKSTDKGKNWTMITNKLPSNGTIHTIEQDPVNQNLLFAGSEFAFYFSVDGGNEWIEFKSGLPTSAVRDIAIQERETDLVIATFGRGFYILDDYSPLRNFSKDILEKDAYIFPVKEAKMFVETEGFDNQGSTYFKAPNPPYGAAITYFIKDVPKTDKAIRQEKEKALFEKGEKITQPSYETLQAEEKEIKPYLIFTVTDENNNVVRQIFKSASKGVSRVNWNFTYSGFSPVTTTKFDPLSTGRNGIMAMPGTYKVSLAMFAKGEIKDLSGPVLFTCRPLDIVTFPATDTHSKLTWLKEASDYARSIYGTVNYTNELISKTNAVMQALQLTPASTTEMKMEAGRLMSELEAIIFRFRGPEARASSEEIPPADVPLYDRLNEIAFTSYSLSGNISQIAKDQLDILKSEFPPVLERVTRAGEDLQKLEKQLDAIKAPWSTGRVPKL